MNSVNLTGRLTRDPELHSSSNGEVPICSMRLAVDRRGEGAVFCDVKCFRAQANACAKHLSKGSAVGISGRLELDEWTSSDGSKRSRLYVIAQRVEFLSRTTAQQSERTVSDMPSADPAEMAATTAGNGEDDIAF